MRLVSCQGGELQVLSSEAVVAKRGNVFTTGLQAVDELAPGGAFSYGAIHELLSEPGEGLPLFVATMLARAARGSRNEAVVWSDPQGKSGGVYPPALAAAGIPLERLFLLHPKARAEEVWAVAECLRCPGVHATVAHLGKLSRIEARRLQLAAEMGGGVGILLRPSGSMSEEYAAATRWVVRRMPGERTVQRWKLHLIHGHGGRVGQSVILEAGHETNHVRAFAAVVDRSIPATDGAGMRRLA
ncbi:MAG: ImuA family protein [Bacillota bacterium]